MINSLLKNICLIIFALICPISLPAGGIQKSFNQHNFLNNTKEILLEFKTSLYSFPQIDAKKLIVLDSGTSIKILRNWKVNEKEIDSDTFNNTLEEKKRDPVTTMYASFGGYVEDYVESCEFTNFKGSPYLTLKLRDKNNE